VAVNVTVWPYTEGLASEVKVVVVSVAPNPADPIRKLIRRARTPMTVPGFLARQDGHGSCVMLWH
jgi:hypothetical protein